MAAARTRGLGVWWAVACGLFYSSAPAVAQVSSLSLSSGTGNAGTTISLALSFGEGGTAPAGLQWTLVYPSSQISSSGATAGPAATAAGKALSCASGPGLLTCVVIGLNTNAIGAGVIANVQMTLAADATTTSIGISNPVGVDATGSALPALAAAGGIIAVPTSISSISCAPGILYGGQFSTCAATLNTAAPAGGSAISLTSNNSALAVPASVTVAAGATTATFSATAASIASNQSATVTATLGSSSQTATLSLLTGVAPIPTLTSVQNPASNIPAALPNGGIAQGSVFVLYGGNMGPATLLEASGYPLPSTAGLGGTVVTITVNGTTVTAPLVYSWASQVAGILPSNTPLGAGTVTVTFAGTRSPSFPIAVVDTNFGISTDPTGLYAAVTYANYAYVAQSNAAQPGQELLLWGTGLGPISSSDAVVPTTNVSSSLSIQVWVGGAQATVMYRGRSAEPGLDQINFIVPPGVSGCQVSIAVQTGSTLSNYATMAIAPNGGQCSDANAILSTAALSALLAQSSVNVADFRLGQSVSTTYQDNTPSTTTTVKPEALFIHFTQSQLSSDQERLFSVISLGSCLVTVSLNGGNAGSILAYTGLTAGPSVTLITPSRSVLTLTPATGAGDYTDSSNPTSLLPAGVYTASTGPGGVGVGPFSVNLAVAPFVTWTNQSSYANTAIDRTQPLIIQWSGGVAGTYVDITGSAEFGGSGSTGGSIRFECSAPQSRGQFTIPPSVLLALPPEPSGILQVSTIGGEVIQVPGLDAGVFSTSNASSVSVVWK
jgi:trimeric autotransporter adhesin